MDLEEQKQKLVLSQEQQFVTMETIERMMGGVFECEQCHNKKVPEHDGKCIPVCGELKWVCFRCASAIRHNAKDRGWFRFLEQHPEKRKEYQLDKISSN